MRRLVYTMVSLLLLSTLFLAFACSVPTGEEEASVGSGPGFKAPLGIAVEADDGLVVTDIDLKAVLRADPTSGDRTIVSDNSTGSGPSFKAPWDIAVEADGSLVVVDCGIDALNAVVRVAPVSGDRTNVSDPPPGSGPGFGERP
ncbi:MAG: hypothetical protein E3J66_00930, partial [Dehalococcoidia bacterium]